MDEENDQTQKFHHFFVFQLFFGNKNVRLKMEKNDGEIIPDCFEWYKVNFGLC